MDPIHAAGALIVVILLATTRSRWPAGSLLDAFGAGFLPYRADAGWPRGVQEEEPRPWRSAPSRDVDDARPEPHVQVEDVGRPTIRRR